MKLKLKNGVVFSPRKGTTYTNTEFDYCSIIDLNTAENKLTINHLVKDIEANRAVHIIGVEQYQGVEDVFDDEGNVTETIDLFELGKSYLDGLTFTRQYLTDTITKYNLSDYFEIV